jgi:hypothetical protein
MALRFQKEKGEQMKIMIMFPKMAKIKGAKARKAIALADTIEKQKKDDAKKSAKAAPKKKVAPKKSTATKGKKK